MQSHPLAQTLAGRGLTLTERLRCVWTGGLTAQVVYVALNADGVPVARSSFHYNRNPGTYVRQGLKARAGTQRFEALDALNRELLAA